jgi:hypothetical protein
MKTSISLVLIFFAFGLCLNPTLAQNDSFTAYVDFGAPSSEIPFNSFLDVEVGAQQTLAAFFGCGVPSEIVIVDNFAGVDNSGTSTPDPDLGFPASATSDAFFGHTQPINGVSNPTGAIEIRNLTYDPGFDTATISIFASSMGSGNRQTCYTIIGTDTTTVCLDAANNTDEVLHVRASPAAPRPGNIDGYIRIEATAGPDNDTPEGFFYLNALSVIDENLSFILGSLHFYENPWNSTPKIFEVGEDVPVPFFSYNPCLVNIGLEIDGVIVNTLPNVYSHWNPKFTIPNFPSDNARFITFSTNPNFPRDIFARSEPFQIIEPTDSCTVVVLGSESAAGTGPRAIDSLWVNRFRRSYKQFDTRVEVVNLAQDDQSTFQLLPTGSTIPAGIPESVDEMNNISAALALNPQAIIINLQAADAIRGYDAAQQLANYGEIIQAAGNVPVYITTPQPGDYSTSVLAIQLEMRDSTLARFGESAIDFWTPVAETDGTIDSIFSAVDGLQLSNAGHRLLWQNVIEKQIDTLLTCQRVSSTNSPTAGLPLPLKLAPNPTAFMSELSFSLEEDSEATLEIYNAMGQLFTIYGGNLRLEKGETKIEVFTDRMPKGVYFLRLQATSLSDSSARQIGTIRLVKQ